MKQELTPQPDEARSLFELLDQIHLVAIIPDGRTAGREFGSNIEAAIQWGASANASGRNVYWTVNSVRQGVNKKPTKADITQARFAHVDIDPPKDGSAWDRDKALADLQALAAQPSFIVDSGNGLQAFWRLDGKYTQEQVEAVNIAIRDHFEADSCQNIDRPMRVPGFVNYPNRKKREAGRKPTLASWVQEDSGEAFTLDQITAALPAATPIEQAASNAPQLPAGLHTLAMNPTGLDRSKDVIAFACAALREGWKDADIVNVLLDARYPVSAHCLDQDDPQRAARRAVECAHKKVSEESVPEAAQDVVEVQPTITATPFQWREPAFIPTRPWLFGQWLLQGTVASLIAPGGSGKSTFISALALSIASGEDFLGQEVHGGPQNVWIWNLEDDLDELSRSIIATAKHHNLDRRLLEQRLFVDSGLDGAGLCTAIETKGGVEVRKPVYEALTEELIRRDIGFLSVDPFVSSHKVNENDNRAIDEVAKEWARVAKAANCCIMLSHHTNKEGTHKVTTLSSRGASSLTNAARSALVINRLDAESAAKFGIEPHEARQYINVSDDKHNRAPAAKADWFKIVSVDLGNGMPVNIEGMRPFTIGSDSVGVIEPVALSEAAQQVEPELIGQVQEMIAAGPYNRESAQAKNWAGHAVAEVLGLCAKGDRAKIKALLSQWVIKGYLKAVKKTDPETRKPNVPYLEVGKEPEAQDESESAPPVI